MRGEDAEAGMSPRALDGATLEPALAKSRLALVEFWADWCWFSRLLFPKSRWLAARYGDHLLVARCRLDGSEAAIARIGIRYLPAVVLFRAGKPLRKWYGDVPASGLVRAVESLAENANG
jgi:thioredoxin-like negative regulator of GroEL